MVSIPKNYKAEICKQILFSGDCTYKERCTFAHSYEEIYQTPKNHNNFKQVECKKFKNGYCPYGYKCHFKHTLHANLNILMHKKISRLPVFKAIIY